VSADIIGIDLGTTNSAVGVVESGFPILLADGQGRRITPSAVYYAADGSVEVGHAAMRRQALAPQQVVTSIKRLMGRRFDELAPGGFALPLEPDSQGMACVRMGPRLLRPEDVSAEILRHLKAVAEMRLERRVARAVITVPAYFNDAQRNATLRAGELAGLKVERILNEPTAATLAYGLDKLDERSRVAVYDLGGGTFDLSVLEMHDGVFQVIATLGDTSLGGDDLDEAVGRWIAARSGRCWDGLTLGGRVRLLAAAEAAKIELGERAQTVVRLPFFDAAGNLEQVLDRDQLGELAAPLLERTRRLCARALSDAGAGKLDAAVLVGGSTRLAAVRALAGEIFGREPDVSQHPDETVALGATIQAGVLSGALRNMVLLDVTPLSLGLESLGGLMNVIIPRNTTIPCKAGEMFTNAVSGQHSMRVRVLQGERELAKDNWELGQLEVAFQPAEKGRARVGIQFSLDENGILGVLARDIATGVDTLLEIRDSAVNVDDEEVALMVGESIEYAFEDMAARVFTEARLKAEELLPAVEQAMEQAADLLDAAEIAGIRACEQAVREALVAGDANPLKAAVQALDQATERLAALLVELAMEEALGRSLQGE
jgi:molecular chaperone DnaK